MNDKATINDLLDLLRVETNDAVDALQKQAVAIQRRAAADGRFNSGSMITALLNAAEATCKARIDDALKAMSEAIEAAGLDKDAVRDMGLQHLQELPERCRSAVKLSSTSTNAAVLRTVEERMHSLHDHLRYKARQFAIGWAGGIKGTQEPSDQGSLSPQASVEPLAQRAPNGHSETTADTSPPLSQAPVEPITAFISYSWDDDGHKGWVRELAERLVANGVHVHLDQWDVIYGDSLTQFMEERLPEADFVLVVCTPTYARKSIQRLGGVGYEAQIISARVAAGFDRRKFVPIVKLGGLRPTEPDCSVPPHFQGVLAIDMRLTAQFDAMFEELLRHLYGQPSLRRPALGPPPSFIGTAAATTEEASTRLANYEVEGWELQSGVVRNELHPLTFEIPDEASRRDIVAGDFVKLMFEYVYEDADLAEELGGGGERMWVEVEGFNGPYLVGKLRNMPVCAVEHDLEFGSRVVFLPEHVITIDRGGVDAGRDWWPKTDQPNDEKQ